VEAAGGEHCVRGGPTAPDAAPVLRSLYWIAEALRTIVEFDLSDLQAIEPPRGFGRD
jgi:hypothetical protein